MRTLKQERINDVADIGEHLALTLSIEDRTVRVEPSRMATTVTIDDLRTAVANLFVEAEPRREEAPLLERGRPDPGQASS